MVSRDAHMRRQNTRRQNRPRWQTNNNFHDDLEDARLDREDMALLHAVLPIARSMGLLSSPIRESEFHTALDEFTRLHPTAHLRAVARSRADMQRRAIARSRGMQQGAGEKKSKSRMRITETVTRVGSDKDAVVLDRIYKVAKSMGMRFKTGRIHADDMNIKKNKQLVACNLSRLHHYYLRKKSSKSRRQNNKKTTNKYGVHLSRKEQIEQNRISVKLNALYEAAKSQGLKMECRKNNLSDFDNILGEVNRLGHTVARSLRNIHAYNLQKRTRTRSSRNRKKKRKSGTQSSRIK